MITPYLPAWIVGLISPVVNLISERISPNIRPVVILAICAAIIVGTVWLTPLLIDELPVQIWALFCIVTGAYTLAKPVEGKAGPGTWVTSLVFGGALLSLPFAAAYAQGVPVEPSGSFGVAWSILGAIVARILRRWFK